ncbi:MAG: Maf-like protein [Acidimicrobiia bacterium]|nr:Maf-like protein [Acidimicrobiia bacterium]
MAPPPLLSASASPRRADLLHAAGYTFDVPARALTHVDERRVDAETPETRVRRVAEAKARGDTSSSYGWGTSHES